MWNLRQILNNLFIHSVLSWVCYIYIAVFCSFLYCLISSCSNLYNKFCCKTSRILCLWTGGLYIPDTTGPKSYVTHCHVVLFTINLLTAKEHWILPHLTDMFVVISKKEFLNIFDTANNKVISIDELSMYFWVLPFGWKNKWAILPWKCIKFDTWAFLWQF